MSNFLCGLTRNITPHSMENLAFRSFTQMRDDYTTNSHYLTHTFLFRKVRRMYFLSLGVKGVSVLKCGASLRAAFNTFTPKFKKVRSPNHLKENVRVR